MKTLILSLFASASVAIAGYAPRAGGIDQANVAVTGGTINGTAIGGTTPAAVSATRLSATSATAEHLITGNYVNNGVDKANVLALRHTSSIGSCAVRLLRYQDTYEMGAMGFQNGGGSFYLDGCIFLAGEPVDTNGQAPVAAPTPVTLAQGGYYLGAKTQSKRLLYDSDWKLKFFSPTGSQLGQWGENGGLQIGGSSDTAVTLDVVGNILAGSGPSQTGRNNTASGFSMGIIAAQGSANLLRMVRDNIGKVDFLWQTSPNRLEFTDADNSSVLPLTVYLDGSRKVRIGKLNLTNLPTSASGLASGDVWSNAGVLTIVP